LANELRFPGAEFAAAAFDRLADPAALLQFADRRLNKLAP